MRTPQILDHGIKSTCGVCGHSDDFDLFTSTPISGDLPAGHYQCPNKQCGHAWEVRARPNQQRNEIAFVDPLL